MGRMVTVSLSLLVWWLLFFGGAPLWGAGIAPLEQLPDKLQERHITDLAEGHAAAAAQLQQGMERVFATMEMTSPEKMASGARAVAEARQLLEAAGKAAAELSTYVAANRGRLVGSQARFLPLAKLNEQLEAPYYRSLDGFLNAAHELLTFAGPNYEKISVGSPGERQRYEELYQAYVRALESLNDQGAVHAKRLTDWLNRYEELRDLLPK